MPDVITLGETMAVMTPQGAGPLRYIPDYRLRFAGAESNLAIGLCKLGHSAGWISRVGDDEMGAFIKNSLRAEGVDISRVKVDAQHRTGLMLKEFGAGETKVYYYRENSAASHLCAGDIDQEYVKSAQIVHVTGITPVLSESCRAAVERLVQMAEDNDIPVSFDVNLRRKLWKDADYTPLMRSLMARSQIVFTGLDEARQVLGAESAQEAVDCMRRLGVKYMAVKDGANGAWAADESNSCFIEPVTCRSVDPVGAGDAFDAAFLAGILRGENLETCGRMGAIAGAMATQTPGDIEGCPDERQMQLFLNKTGEIYR